MRVSYTTNEQPVTLKVFVKTQRQEEIRIRVFDSVNIPNTTRSVAVYEDRTQKVYGVQTFFVKMPCSPKVAVVEIYNVKRGNLPSGADKSFAFKIEPVALEATILPLYIPQKKARDFMIFAQDFAKQKNITSAGYSGSARSIYMSHDKTLRIDYYDVLRDVRRTLTNPYTGQVIVNPRFMQEVTTPMRTQADTGIIEVSKRYTDSYTVPEFIAVLAHEFCHTKVNEKPEDEFEADRNAAIIVLSMGYGKIPTYTAFLKVFRNADNKGNRMREEKLYDFIEKFSVGSSFLIA